MLWSKTESENLFAPKEDGNLPFKMKLIIGYQHPIFGSFITSILF